MRDHAFGPPPRASEQPDLSEVHPKLLVGAYPIPVNARWLNQCHAVTAVVNLQDDGDLRSKGLQLSELEAAYDHARIVFSRVPITDYDPSSLVAQLERAIDAVDTFIRDGHRVYLHCNAGVNRAPTVAIAWLHARGGLSLAEAYDLVRQRRPCAPYVEVLKDYFRA